MIFQDLIVTLMIYPLQLLNWLLIQQRRNSTLIPSRGNYSRKNNIHLIFINQAQTTIDIISTCSFCLPIFIKKCQNTYSSILKEISSLIPYIQYVCTCDYNKRQWVLASKLNIKKCSAEITGQNSAHIFETILCLSVLSNHTCKEITHSKQC